MKEEWQSDNENNGEKKIIECNAKYVIRLSGFSRAHRLLWCS